MDGLTRLMGFTAEDRIATERRRADEAFRASHRQPDALPDEPITVPLAQRRGPVSRLARLVLRLGAA